MQLIDLALNTFQTVEGKNNTEFYIDSLHQNSTAQIKMKKPGESEYSFKFTIWVPGVQQLNHDTKSYEAVTRELILLKQKILSLGKLSP